MINDRCPECGSWERSCISPTPVADCGCQRCLRARLAAAVEAAYREGVVRGYHDCGENAPTVMSDYAWLASEARKGVKT